MNRYAAALVFLPLFLPAAVAQAPYPDGLGATGRQGFEQYRRLGFNKVFAMNRDGKWAWQQNSAKQVPEMAEDVLKICNKDAKTPCAVASVNDVDMRGRDPAAPPPDDGKPIGALVPGPYYPILGPARAAGILIWSHGVLPGDDNTRHAPQGYVNRFRDAGWDIYKFDRSWPDYRKDLGTLIDMVPAVRAAGYKRVILAGQSVGAWVSLEAAAKGAPVDGVIAAAPARFGKDMGSTSREKNREELMPVLEALMGRDVPVALMFFADDQYEPGGRGPQARAIFARAARAKPLLIDGAPGVAGHGGAGTTKFVTEYGACLVDFILKLERRAPCS